MTSEAIVIGVNKYQHLQPLEYAQQDAKAIAAFLKTEAKFDHVYYFAEDAEDINGISMQPTQNNLRRILQTRVAKRGLGDGDNFWFFFSGHGMRDGERDFLMPIDGYAEDVAASGISTAQVSEWLRGCGADNVVMILDACRSGGRKDGKGIGDETKEGCRQTGVISLFSCSPNQFSYELPQYQQGAFTKVLLEGLGVQGACATVARLDEYLKRRVPEVVRECLGNSVNQFPYSIAEPINKSHLILMPQHSRPEDLNALKTDAFRAQVKGDVRSAYRCWLRVNIASGGMDMEAIDAIVDLKPKLLQSISQPTQPKSQPTSEVPISKGDLGGSSAEAKLEELEGAIVPQPFQEDLCDGASICTKDAILHLQSILSKDTRKKTPVTIVTGSLNSGKTTLINRIIASRNGINFSIICCEFGDVNFDPSYTSNVEIIDAFSTHTCKLATDKLLDAIYKALEKETSPDYIIIEASGLASTLNLALVVLNEDLLRLDSILTVIDSENLQVDLSKNESLLEQIMYGDILIFNKVELTSKTNLTLLEALIYEEKENARILYAEYGKVELPLISGLGWLELDESYSLRGFSEAISLFVFESKKCFDLHKFQHFLGNEVPMNVFKVHALLWFKEDPDHQHIFYMSGNRFQVEELLWEGDRKNQMVFIGMDLDAQLLRSKLDDCLSEL
jgi:G3E family GTPase/uncharacterized caspase-like protein